MTKAINTRRTADVEIPVELTESFISDFQVLLSADPRRKARVQEGYFLQKFVSEKTDSADVRRSRAIEKWLGAETRNSVTNRRLRSQRSLDFYVEGNVTFRNILQRAKLVVLQVIGDCPSYSPLHCGFSGGATTSRKRVDGHPAIKFLDKADVTRSAYSLFYETIRGTEWERVIHDSGLEVRIVPGNVMFTVPKNAQIDRAAAKEPDLNIFLQKGLGNQIRWALRRCGIDLNDQSKNAELARRGSIDGRLATLDLSSASDSVTTELVRIMIPPLWFDRMEHVISPFTIIDGEPHRNEMFSSMGNGFTFELESLLFYALARSTCFWMGVRGAVSVYGDDIILPSEAVDAFTRVLQFFGFSVNPEKSFSEGSFRESCGSYWEDGEDVKPFFLRQNMTRLSDLILTLNSLTRWSTVIENVEVEGYRKVAADYVDPHYVGLHHKYARFIPESLWGGQDTSSRYSLVTGHRPRKELVPIVKKKELPSQGALLLWLHTCDERNSVSESVTISASTNTGNYRVRRNLQVTHERLPYFISW